MSALLKATLLTSLAVSVAVAADPAAFEGTWKLNVAKSKFQQPAKKAQTITITKEGATIEETMNDGAQRRWSYKGGDGKESPITGLPDSSVTFGQSDDRTVEHTWNMGSRTTTGKGQLSADGKTMTYTLTGKTEEGKPFKDVMVFEKQ